MSPRNHTFRVVFSFAFAAILIPAAAVRSEDPKKSEQPEKPTIEGRPVLLVAGKLVLFPAGVDEAPEDYKGSIGPRPLALVKIDDMVVGEIYVARLKGTPADEAKEMATTADKNKTSIKLQKQETVKVGDEDVEVVTLHMSLKSHVGTPWILHSLYFPQGESSVTFKLVASEEQFETVLPYFETMLRFGNEEADRK